MSMPDAGTFALALYTELESLTYAEEELDYPLLKFLQAICQAADEVETLARDTDTVPGWGTLLDPNNTPDNALDWLAQFVGTVLDHSLSIDDQRSYILAAANWRRGTVQAIIETAQYFLTGDKTVIINERDSSPYHYTVIVNPAEVTDLDMVKEALDKQKPAGLVYQLILSTTHTYYYVKTTYATYGAAKAANPTYLNLRGG